MLSVYKSEEYLTFMGAGLPAFDTVLSAYTGGENNVKTAKSLPSEEQKPD